LSFAPSQFISIGSYVGNGNANGTFIPTVNSLGIPIQPAWFMTKNTTGTEQGWRLVRYRRILITKDIRFIYLIART
jgi:hypothetical protein